MNPPTTPPVQQAGRFLPIIRDVAIIVAATFIGGFCIGLTGLLKSQYGMLAIAASNVFFATAGFARSGRLARGNRWRHLAIVAVGVWLVGLNNVLLFGIGIMDWIFSIIYVGISMGLGGALSYVFRGDDSPSA